MSESRLKIRKILRFARNMHLRRVIRTGGRNKTLGEGDVGANLIGRLFCFLLYSFKIWEGQPEGGERIVPCPPASLGPVVV